MEDITEGEGERNLIPAAPGKGRKRLRQESKRKKTKKARHCPKQLPIIPRCGHNGKPGFPYFCATLKTAQIKRFHDILYSTSDKVKQDMFLLKCCNGHCPKTNQAKKRTKNKVSINYNIPDGTQSFVRVCKKAFLDISGVSRFRIERVVKNFLLKMDIPKERRGGDRVGNKNDDKKNAIKLFIESLKCVESHYCRNKTFDRLYFPCELNLKKIYSMYTSKVEQNLRVKLSYFRNYVNQNYNFGFGTPKTDVWSTCLRTAELLKNPLEEKEKLNIMVQQRLHRLKAKAFYHLLKNEEETVQNFSFDCQKNLALPKLPDQACYFSQQLNYYHFAIVNGSSKGKLDRNNVFSYLWLESDAAKDSNTISSAVHHFLKNFNFKETTKKVRLFADGCGGQNKNSIVLAMLSSWLLNDAADTIEQIEMIFPIVGHSFMPPDRLFGIIERKLRKIAVIVKPKQYDEVIHEYATIRNIDNWNIFDWRTESNNVLKRPGLWHFQFNKNKRFILTRNNKNNNILVRGELNYKIDTGMAKGICKRGKSSSLLAPRPIAFGRILKGDKTTINRLLNLHFGDNWRENKELELYNKIMLSSTETGTEDVEVLEEGNCHHPEYEEMEI